MNKVAIRRKTVAHDPVAVENVVALAVGDVSSWWSRQDGDLADRPAAFADFSDVTPDLIEALNPEIVVSSVFGRNFDCVDLAQRLSDIGYEGRYRMIGYGMPQPDLVLREIKALFPELRVEMTTPAPS